MASTNTQEFFDRIEEFFIPENTAGIDASIEINLSGEGGGTWTLEIADQRIVATPGKALSPVSRCLVGCLTFTG